MNDIRDLREGENDISKTKIFTLLGIYLFLTLSSRYSQSQNHHGLTITDKIISPIEEIRVQDLGNLYGYDQQYTGVWSGGGQGMGLTETGGSLQMMFGRIIGTNNKQFSLKLWLKNGQYIDQGALQVNMLLDADKFKSTRPEDHSLALKYRQEVLEGSYSFTKVLLIEDQGPIKIKSLFFLFSLQNNGRLKVSIQFQLQQQQPDTEKLSLILTIKQRQQKLIKHLIFAFVVFVIAYNPFITAMELLKNIFEGSENPLHYSLISVTVATMWDAVVCMLAFKMAFGNQESLIMFILPAFMLCLLFTNIEPRLMFVIYERSQLPDGAISSCGAFNFISYGSLFLIYPILIFSNLNRFLFIGLSLIFLPQIYLNAVRSNRPNYTTDYYTKFLFSRFLLILYLRCFPWNIFELKPDYTLGFMCLFLLIVQFGILRVQNKYGPKIVVPKWMLEPVYDYNYQEAINLEEGGDDKDCAICLLSLRKQPLDSDTDIELPFRLMNTPCKHTYHSSCLISWMKIKMVCPQCRSVLPPYD